MAPFLQLSEAVATTSRVAGHPRPDFVAKLDSDIIPLLEQYSLTMLCDVVEVIGHTDEVPMVAK